MRPGPPGCPVAPPLWAGRRSSPLRAVPPFHTGFVSVSASPSLRPWPCKGSGHCTEGPTHARRVPRGRPSCVSCAKTPRAKTAALWDSCCCRFGGGAWDAPWDASRSGKDQRPVTSPTGGSPGKGHAEEKQTPRRRGQADRQQAPPTDNVVGNGINQGHPDTCHDNSAHAFPSLQRG